MACQIGVVVTTGYNVLVGEETVVGDVRLLLGTAAFATELARALDRWGMRLLHYSASGDTGLRADASDASVRASARGVVVLCPPRASDIAVSKVQVIPVTTAAQLSAFGHGLHYGSSSSIGSRGSFHHGGGSNGADGWFDNPLSGASGSRISFTSKTASSSSRTRGGATPPQRSAAISGTKGGSSSLVVYAGYVALFFSVLAGGEMWIRAKQTHQHRQASSWPGVGSRSQQRSGGEQQDLEAEMAPFVRTKDSHSGAHGHEHPSPSSYMGREGRKW